MLPKAQENNDLHLLVPGARVVDGSSQPTKSLHLGVPTNLLIPHMTLWVVLKGSKMHMAYSFWSLVLVAGAPGHNQ